MAEKLLVKLVIADLPRFKKHVKGVRRAETILRRLHGHCGPYIESQIRRAIGALVEGLEMED